MSVSLDSLSQLPIDGKLKTLSDIKVAVLGNDKEKQKLITQFKALKTILLNESNTTLLQDAAIIIQSFSYLKKNIDFLIDNNVVEILIISTVKHQDALAEINFRTLIDICASSSVSILNLLDFEENGLRLIEVIHNILSGPSTKQLLFNTCILIPFIKSCKQLTKLYKPLMKKLSIAISSAFKTVLNLNNSVHDHKSFENCTKSITIPEPPPEHTLDLLCDEVSPMLYALSHLIEVIHSELSVSLTLPQPLYYTLTSFLNAYNLNIKLSAINVLVQYTKHFMKSALKETSYLKLAPSLVSLISRMKDSNELDNSLNSNYRLTKKMAPIYLLSQIAEDNAHVSEYLVEISFFEKIAGIITSSYSHEQKFLDEKSLYKISDSLLILSCIGGLKENYRELVIKYDVAPIITDSLGRHIEIHKELSSTTPNANEELILKLSNRITLSSCYLLRSLSRSASLLRTYLVELNLVDLLIEILKIPETSIKDCSPELQHDEVLLKSVALGIISNLVMEFSAVAQDLASDDLSKILREFIYYSQYDILRLNALLVIRNSLFGDFYSFRENFEKAVTIEKIFDLCYDPNNLIKEQCFNIFRNLSVSSSNYANHLVSYFPNSPAAKKYGDATFLDFLLKHVSQSTSTEVTLAINYIIVHLAASNVENRSLIMCNDALLRQLLKLLEPTPAIESRATTALEINDENEEEEDQWKIKLSVVWIIINLTWKEETSNSDSEAEDGSEDHSLDYEAMEIDEVDNSSASSQYTKYLSSKYRAHKLIDIGFYDAIKLLNSICTISDFKERARTAIFHLVLYDTNNQSN
ncbi:hypothetical protein CANARDRAFT_30029 [[Candida] arabinofermentans NRRL YB-2248]|uniref:Uncharacterized protein n=1 Tax=[Candida] arabinofermentans NRRL YB-2248 TaxID=983967 RepID=A0A1E4SV73_9ASCO|nr:hypothetical protein CANARDRAFT_30029 [[Candida] arabinofermentans NRRL YB-2248]